MSVVGVAACTPDEMAYITRPVRDRPYLTRIAECGSVKNEPHAHLAIVPCAVVLLGISAIIMASDGIKQFTA